MFRYRLYTEALNIERLRELFSMDFDAYTIFNGAGVWQGNTESSVVFEVVSDRLGALSSLHGIARIIREENKQQAVLVTREPVESFLF